MQDLLNILTVRKNHKNAIKYHETIPLSNVNVEVRSISQLGNLASRLERAGDGLGVHILDTEIMQLKQT
jgi:hypothetical protein